MRLARPFGLVLVALVALWWAPLAPRAQPVPPPLFTTESVGALCGALSDHERLLRINGFEPAWRGAAAADGGAFAFINHEGYWVVLLVFPQSPDRACVVAEGPRFEYAPAPL